ncbi:hypothetical protein ScPMuIL_000217 [Solemya velum]
MADLATEMKALHLAEKSAICLEEMDEDFVLDIALQNRSSEDGFIAATSSNYTIRLFSKNSLVSTASITAHKDVITGVKFSHDEPNILYSSSMDETVKSWDLRTDMKKPVQMLEGYADPHTKFAVLMRAVVDVYSVQVPRLQKTAMFICYSGRNSISMITKFVFFFLRDRRKAEILGAYTESHQDDITQVCFHPSQADILGTRSTDGLVNVFDVSQSCEDDALQFTLNSQSSVARIGWCGEKTENIFCVTHVDTYHLWETKEARRLSVRIDRYQGESGEWCGLPDRWPVFWKTTTACASAGTHKGDIKLLDVTGEEIEVRACLEGGHRATVRSVEWDQQRGDATLQGDTFRSTMGCVSSKLVPENPPSSHLVETVYGQNAKIGKATGPLLTLANRQGFSNRVKTGGHKKGPELIERKEIQGQI